MVDLKRLDELHAICRKCKPPKRYPACESHCEIGRERVELNNQKRDEEHERKKRDYENRTYIRNAVERARKK